jgi:hypothetical protein
MRRTNDRFHDNRFACLKYYSGVRKDGSEEQKREARR